LALIYLPEVITAQSILARKGTLDLRQVDFAENGPVNLSGEWDFFMSELVPPDKFIRSETTQDYVDFPSTWNEESKSLNPGEGFATYHLKVLVKSPKTFSLELPHFYSNYKLWINSNPIASNGIVGTSAKNSKPQWLPQTITFNADKDTLDFVIQASNFFHAKGGVREQLRLGTTDDLLFKHEIAVNSNLALCGSLLLTGVVFLFMYFFVKRQSSILYFSALCFTWGLRSIFSNLYVFTSYFPEFPWELSVKIEYITLYLVMICAILFVASLFKNEVNSLFKYFLCICNTIFILLTVFSDASFYTQFLPVYLSFCGVLILYVTYVLIRAFVYEREGVWLMVGCLFLGVILFSYDIIAYEGFAAFNPVIINFGYLTMFALMGICLLYQLGFLKKSSSHRNILTYEDLYGAPKEIKR
jgi:7TM protein involved in diverse intracellular signaling